DLLGRLRVRRRAPQRADGHVGLLWHQEQAGVRLDQDLALAPGPQPRDGAHQRALAGPRFAHHQHLSPRAAPTSPSVATPLPPSSVTERFRRRSAMPSVSPCVIRPVPSSRSASSRRSGDTSSEPSRRADAAQSASRGELSTSQLNATWTVTKADDSCMTPPQVLLPSTYLTT